MAPAGERGTGRPKDADELAAWSEMAADAVARTESDGFKKPRTHESVRGTAATHAMEGESRAREGKPAATLKPKARTGAVSADVAGRLHLHSDKIGAGDARSALRSTGPEIIEDVLRVASSNGKIDAPGETNSHRTHHPAQAVAVRTSIEHNMVEQLMTVAASDISRESLLPMEVALELAGAVMEGNICVQQAMAADRKMAPYLKVDGLDRRRSSRERSRWCNRRGSRCTA